MKKILVCDDSLAEMKLIQSVLQQAGYWSVPVSDSRQIEKTIEVERPHLILLDVVMPDRNGYQVCRDLKGNAEFSRIPVIIVSSKSLESDKFWAKQQGADGYVIKPFTAVQLLDAVKRFV
ncbi:MAG TPA: response regulator [Terriglobales bacterium]|nr:response regulator [Terriglobales bacterium]